jgi:hypothetical protein
VPDHLAVDARRLGAVDAHVEGKLVVHDDIRKGVRARFPVLNLEIGRPANGTLGAGDAPDHSEPVRLRERRRLQERGVDEREDAGAGTDAQGERERDGRGIAAALAKCAERELEITEHAARLA